MSNLRNEFPRPVRVDRLAPGETMIPVAASADERAALARRFGLPAIESLTAELRLKRLPAGGGVRLRGRLVADVVQSCVVSLEPVPAHVEERFALVYAPERASRHSEGGEIVLTIDEADPPEPIVDGVIDIGEAVAEHLALALDPFPRAPGAVFANQEGQDDAADQGRESPFAALAALKKRG